MSGWFQFLLAWFVITATNVLGLIKPWLNSLILPFYWTKKFFFCFPLFWILEVALPCQKGSVRFLSACKFDFFFFFFWPLKVVQGFVVVFVFDFFSFFFAITLHYNLPKQHKLVWDHHKHHNCLRSAIFASGQMWRRHPEGTSLSCSCFTLV